MAKIDLSNGQAHAIIEWARESRLVLEVYLFGSRAKGTARVESDVDLAVSVETQPGWTNKNTYDQNWLEWVTDLEERVGQQIELLRLHADNPRTSAAVLEAGVLLYRRENS